MAASDRDEAPDSTNETPSFGAGVFVFPTWAAQSRGVTAGGKGGAAGRGHTFREGDGKRLIS